MLIRKANLETRVWSPFGGWRFPSFWAYFLWPGHFRADLFDSPFPVEVKSGFLASESCANWRPKRGSRPWRQRTRCSSRRWQKPRLRRPNSSRIHPERSLSVLRRFVLAKFFRGPPILVMSCLLGSEKNATQRTPFFGVAGQLGEACWATCKLVYVCVQVFMG